MDVLVVVNEKMGEEKKLCWRWPTEGLHVTVSCLPHFTGRHMQWCLSVQREALAAGSRYFVASWDWNLLLKLSSGVGPFETSVCIWWRTQEDPSKRRCVSDGGVSRTLRNVGVYLMAEPVGPFETSVCIYRTVMRQIPAVNSLWADVSPEE